MQKTLSSHYHIASLPYPITNEEAPEVFVACEEAYKEGCTHGAWIKATNEQQMEANILHILSIAAANSKRSIFLGSRNFQGVNISKYEGIHEVAEMGKCVVQHGQALGAYLQHYFEKGISKSVFDFNKQYKGIFNRREEFVYDLLEKDGTLAKIEALGLEPSHVDWEHIAIDWFETERFTRYFDIKLKSSYQIYVFNKS